MLEVRGLEKRFPDGTAALRQLSLTVPRGQFCVVLGASGAGKSTLLRAVIGLTEASAGRIVVDGVEVARRTLARVRRDMAMIHQQFALVPRLTVLTNVLTGLLDRVSTLRALGNVFPQPARRRACELLADVGLEESHLYRRAAQLSGGQQQRVAIARAFIREPKLVLADEPVASLDRATSQTILGLLRDTSTRHGTTVLCSLHQVELARAFADRVVGLRDGAVVYDGAPAGLDEAALARIYAREPS